MKFCSNCYSPLKDDELFCSNCGARVSGHNETTAQGHDKPEHEHLEPTQSHDNPEHEHLEPNQDPTDYGDNFEQGQPDNSTDSNYDAPENNIYSHSEQSSSEVDAATAEGAGIKRSVQIATNRLSTAAASVPTVATT